MVLGKMLGGSMPGPTSTAGSHGGGLSARAGGRGGPQSQLGSRKKQQGPPAPTLISTARAAGHGQASRQVQASVPAPPSSHEALGPHANATGRTKAGAQGSRNGRQRSAVVVPSFTGAEQVPLNGSLALIDPQHLPTPAPTAIISSASSPGLTPSSSEACFQGLGTAAAVSDAAAHAPTHAPSAAAGDSAPVAAPNWTTQQLALEGVPEQLHCLLDPDAPVTLPSPGSLPVTALDNSRLDRLVAALGRGRATWKRALLLYQWLKSSQHEMDDRLCTTLIRVCADHGDAVSALGVYEWMRSPVTAGGAGLAPTAYTYTAAMRAALGVGMLERAMQVWADSQAAGLIPDCRLCITYIETCTRLGLTDKALAMYYQMRDAPPGSPMKPSVHGYTAAMRAATEGGRWMRALGVWEDMRRSGTQPTGHAYAAAISACAAGQDWARAVALFDDMTSRAGIRPDVVSCTALVTALASAGEADKAEAVVTWMHGAGLKPNVRTYTALLTALGNARQWSRAVRLLFAMQQPENGNVQPNAYTYSALIKALGEGGQWQLAEAIFDDIERTLRVKRTTDLTGSHVTSAPLPPVVHTPRVSHSGSSAAAPPAPQLTAAEAAERMAFARRLLAAASVADAMQQAGTSQVPGAVTAAGSAPAQVMQQMHVVDGSAVTMAPAGSVGGGSGVAAGSGSTHVSPRGPVSAAGGAPPVPSPAPHMSHALRGDAVRSTAPGGSSWSHPSQLNGIQVDIRGASQPGPAPATAPVSYPGAAATLASHAVQPGSGVVSQAGSRQSTQPGSPVSSPGAAPGDVHGAAAPGWDPLSSPNTLLSASPASAATLALAGASGAPATEFSFFSSPPKATSSSSGAVSDPPSPAPAPTHALAGNEHGAHGGAHTAGHGPHSGSAVVPVVNEVVCGSMMLAYERGGRWQEAVHMLGRARALGLEPNLIMYNMGISAAGKAGQVELAERLFVSAPGRDVVTYEAMVLAYGVAARPDKAEHVFAMIGRAGFRPREFGYCGLITAHSMAGAIDAALAVRRRMARDGVTPTVHTYNLLLAACERGGRYEHALDLLQTMKREGVEPNLVTHQLMSAVGQHGVEAVENQQVAAGVLSAVLAAAAGGFMRAGMF